MDALWEPNFSAQERSQKFDFGEETGFSLSTLLLHSGRTPLTLSRGTNLVSFYRFL